MTLYVCLGRDIQAVLVAQVVPAGIVRVMARADGVDVELLHYLDVLNHALHAHHIASIRVELVAVGTLDEHRLTVDEQLAAADAYVAEAHLLAYHLGNLIPALQRDVQVVEIRRLGRPRLGILHRDDALETVSRRGGTALADNAAPGIRKHGRDSQALGCGRGNVVCQHAVAVSVGKVLPHGDILDMGLRTRIEVHLAGYSGEAPEVLVLQIGAVAPPHHLHGNEITARTQVFRDVKLSRNLAVLAVADVLSVDPYRQVACGRPYMEVDAAALPVVGQDERAAVRAGVVVRFRDVRGIALECSGPRIARILIYTVAISVDFEESGNGEIHPFGIVETGLVELYGTVGIATCEVELPLAFHRQIAR